MEASTRLQKLRVEDPGAKKKVKVQLTRAAMNDRQTREPMALYQPAQVPDGAGDLEGAVIRPGMVLVVRHLPPAP